MHHNCTTRSPRTPPRQPYEDQPHGRATALRAPRLRLGRPAPTAGEGDHPARRPLPAGVFPQQPPVLCGAVPGALLHGAGGPSGRPKTHGIGNLGTSPCLTQANLIEIDDAYVGITADR